MSRLPLWISAVSSPKYQTLPSLSWAYQSSVISTGLPPSLTTSWTTRAVTPSPIFLVLSVTVITCCCTVPSWLVTRTCHWAPTGSGK